MKDTLVLRFDQQSLEPASQIQWVLLDANQHVIRGEVTELTNVAQDVDLLSDNYQVCVIVAVEEVLLTPVSIPSNQVKQVKQALPFMVEELLAQEIETVHLAVPSHLDLAQGRKIDVGVVSHSVLIHWLDLLHSHGLSPTSITIDVLCLPRDEVSWTLLIDNDRLLIRTGDNAGVACEVADIEMIFGSLVQELEEQGNTAEQVKPLVHLIETQAQSEGIMTKVSDYIGSHFSDFEIKQSFYQETSNEILAIHYLQTFDRTLNLLQGGYRVNTRSDQGIQHWRLAASVAGLGLVAYCVLTLASGVYFSHQTSSLNDNSVALYKRLFPNERRVVSPKKQMQSHLTQLSGDSGRLKINSDFLPLVAQTAQQLGSSDESIKLALQQLRFDSARNDLQLEVQSESIEQLDQFKQLLADAGLSVDINSATEQDNNVVGRLIVRGM